jgi:hypothetical protein
MSKVINLIGMKFGKLTVIERVLNTHTNKTKWKCLCDCGQEKIATATHLKRSAVVRCDVCATPIPYDALYKEFRRKAHRNNHETTITFDDFLEFTKTTECFYCGCPVQWERVIKHGGTRQYNLDRIDNNIGYSIDNCVICCNVCNFMKMKLSKEEFLRKVEQIYLHLQTK